MIRLNDILKLSNEQIDKAKVKFNIHNGYDNPIELYKNNPNIINKEWLYWREQKRYFSVGQIAICLVRIRDDYWLLTTIDSVTKDYNVQKGINYEGVPLSEYDGLYGRLIVKYHNKSMQQGRNYRKIMDELEVSQLLPDIFDDDVFPGYDKVNLSYTQLKNIISRGKRDWIGALENQKAVYLITDTNNGKLYVGSATSDNGMLLQRWSNYANNGHGGNKELKIIVEQKGIEYIQTNFRYSILENYNAKISDEIILEREAWWKNILQTRKFGYNDN